MIFISRCGISFFLFFFSLNFFSLLSALVASALLLRARGGNWLWFIVGLCVWQVGWKHNHFHFVMLGDCLFPRSFPCFPSAVLVFTLCAWAWMSYFLTENRKFV